MQVDPIQVFHQGSARALVAGLAALACGAVWADEPNPYYIGISEKLSHDTNVYRVPNGLGDNYSTTSLVGGFDQSIARQHIYLAGNVGYNRYQDQTTLNHTSYGVNGGWDWASIEKLSGSLNFYANQGLATINGNALIPLSTLNILNTELVNASVQWGGDARLSAVGTYTYNRVNYSAPQYITSNSTSNTLSAGVYYTTNPDLKLGTALRFTSTDTPVYLISTSISGFTTSQPNTADGRNLDFTADWHPTAQTGLNARLSWTQITNTNPAAQDFSGPTGSIYANYAPTAKLTFTAGYAHNAGTYASFFNNPNAPAGQPATGLNAYSQTTTIYSLGAAYAVTAKTSITAGFEHNFAKYAYPSSGNLNYDDNLRTVKLGVAYVGAKHWNLGCDAYHESRGTSGPAGYAYSANSFSCYGQFTLR